MQDRYEREQDLKYEAMKQKKERGRKTIRRFFGHFCVIFAGNAFALVFYWMFMSKYVLEQLMDGKLPLGAVLGFAAIAQLAIMILSASLYMKNDEERRLLLEASREEGFTRIGWYKKTLGRIELWTLPVTFFVFQLPFIIFSAAIGVPYVSNSLFCHFFVPQMFCCSLIGSGIGFIDAFFGAVLNVLLMTVIHGIVIYIAQGKWRKARIRD